MKEIVPTPPDNCSVPYFLILPIWFLFVVVGFAMLLTTRSRHLSTYVVLASTTGLIVSFILSTAILLAFPLLSEAIGLKSGFLGPLIFLGGYLGGIAIGGAAGVIAGVRLARKVNGWLGWRGILS